MTRNKKTTKKSEAKPKVKSEPKQDGVASKEIFYEEGENNYGGIPDRDLKKNLGGCG